MEEEERGVLEKIVAANGGKIPTPEEVAAKEAEDRRFAEVVRSVDDVGDYKSEEDDPDVLIYGPWLERGGSAFWVSTSGTGKSTSCMQLVHCMSAALPFCGLRPRGALKFWVFQSEDSPRRVAQDRIDVRAELAERYPDVDWEEVGRKVKFAELTGAVGVKFLAELDELLNIAERRGEKPDVIVLNPLLAFVGGPITDGAYVTPFLRGGEIGKGETMGLQALLKKHKVGVLVYHHTPKPPTEKEIDGWMKSQFPEYQGAGSADITNWGRSFVTMMRVKGHANIVCCTAGKNGAELGWERVGGAFRRYMAFSDETGVSGKGRHAWRDLTDEEYDEIVGKEKQTDEKEASDAVNAVVEAIKTAPVAPLAGIRALEAFMANYDIKRNVLRSAIKAVVAAPDKFRLTVKPVLHANRKHERHIGLAENLRAAVAQNEQAAKYAEATGKAENPQNVEAVEAMVAPKPAQPPKKTPEEDDDAFPF